MGKTNQLNRRKFFCSMSAFPLVGASFSAVEYSGAPAGQNEQTGEKENEPREAPAFIDARSKKVMFVAHCILNQNARINQCAYTPSAIEPIVRCLLRRHIGIVQLPCPETELLGLGRGEGAEIYDQLSAPEKRQHLEVFTQKVLVLVREYRKYGFQVLGVLGIDGSPCCGVDLMYYQGERPGTGAFMEELIPVLEKESPPVPVRGIKDAELEAAVALIGEMDRD